MSSLQYYNDAVGEKNKKEFGYSQAVVLGDIVKCSGQGGRVIHNNEKFIG